MLVRLRRWDITVLSLLFVCREMLAWALQDPFDDPKLALAPAMHIVLTPNLFVLVLLSALFAGHTDYLICFMLSVLIRGGPSE